MLAVGTPCPDFRLQNQHEAWVSRQDLAGRRFVLYFYPKDDTPGCTTEACQFRDLLPRFGDLGVPVFGVSADDLRRHRRFADKHALPFDLLADPERQLIGPFGLWVEKKQYGRSFFGIQRATAVIGVDGRLVGTWPKVRPDGHAAEVAAWLADHPG